MKIALITCTRNRESHILEFLNHYKDIDTIFLCDNNDIGINKLSTFIKDNVVYMDYKGVLDVQHKCYTDIVLKYKDTYDYYCVFDDDEFITFKGYNNIRRFLSLNKFKDTDIIKLPWVLMLIPIDKIFKLNTINYKYLNELTYIGYSSTSLTKSIFKYRDDLVRVSAHFPVFKLQCIVRDCNGIGLEDAKDIGYKFDFAKQPYDEYINSIRTSLDAYLLHYMCKSKHEYFNKMINLRAICTGKRFYTIRTIDLVCNKYFRYYCLDESLLKDLFKSQYTLFLKGKGLL